MIALIDGDIILYRIGWTTENDEAWIAKARTDDLLDSILLETSASEFEIFLTDNKENNFRHQIWSGYKANRTAPRPKNYEAIKEHLVKEWGAKFAHGMEADDALGIAQDQFGPAEDPEHTGEFKTVICSIDKDLLQIPGVHYNFVKKEWQEVTSWEGLQWFYKQILIGDTSDNIRGCSGVGPVKANRAIDPIYPEEGEEALYQKVLQTYQKYEKGKTLQEIEQHVRLIGKLLKIKTYEEEPEWEPPHTSVSKQTVVEMSSSTPLSQVDPIQSMELISPVETNGSSQHGPKPENSLKAEPVAST